MAQQELFSDAAQAIIAGLRYQPEFIDAATEQDLIEAIRSLRLQEAEYKEYRARRRVAHFGGRYDFDRNELLPAEPIPEFLAPLRDAVGAWAEVPAARLTHALIAEYRPGTPLGWHRDVPDFETIVGVSLGGSCRMRFRGYPPRRGSQTLDLQVAPRSAYALQGEARWDWQHSVSPTPMLRYSITFRTPAERRAQRGKPDTKPR